MPEGALTPFTASDAYRYFVNDVTKVGHAQSLLPTDCIMVSDSYFNFTKKSNLVGNVLYDFFEKLVVAYFFGPPCISGLH